MGLFDGQGRQIAGFLVYDKNQNSYYLLDAKLSQLDPISPQIILAQAASAESKITETLRRGCEFGVDKFVIFNAQKSEPFCLNKLKKRCARLESVLLDASRQSERFFTPSLSFADNFTDF